MRIRPRDPNVVSALDPVSAEVVRGIPYSRRSARLDEPRPSPFAAITRGADGFSLRSVGDEQVQHRILPPTLSVDPADVEVARALAPAGIARVVSSRSRSSRDPGTFSYDGVGTAGLDDLRRHAVVRVEASTYAHPIHAARVVLQLAASGVRCHVARADAHRLSPWLHPRFLDHVTADAADADELSVLSAIARGKTLAWLGHANVVGWDATAQQMGVIPRRPESVSVVLATMRPALVRRAVAQIRAQELVDVEVLIAAHGFGASELDAARSTLQLAGLSGDVVGLPASVPLGSVLNAAVARASGEVVCKWDDDDLYGPLHLADLVAAHRYSGAGLVGKYAEFIHFEEDGDTIWRYPQRAETATPLLAGGTLLAERQTLAALGGFPPLPRAVDHHLRERAAQEGLGVYRTHGFGYALVRHAHGHTWDADHAELRRTARATLRGLPRTLQVEGGSDVGL